VRIPNVPGYRIDLTKTDSATGQKIGDAKFVSKEEWEKARSSVSVTAHNCDI
jgi:hypothetical protein